MPKETASLKIPSELHRALRLRAVKVNKPLGEFVTQKLWRAIGGKSVYAKQP